MLKFFFTGKGAPFLLIAALLLVIQPLAMAPMAVPSGSAVSASHHGCGCARGKAASDACGCAQRHCCSSFCPCCSGSGGKAAALSSHATQPDHPVAYIRSFCCGGPEAFNCDSSAIKCILADFQVVPVMHSVLFTDRSHQEPEKLSCRPAVPPPETAAVWTRV